MTSCGTRRLAHAQNELSYTCVKMPKQRNSRGSAPRHVALTEQILQDGSVRPTNRGKRRGQEADETQDDGYVDEKLSRRILEQARIQQEELEAEHGAGSLAPKQQTTVLGKCLGDYRNTCRACRGPFISALLVTDDTLSSMM